MIAYCVCEKGATKEKAYCQLSIEVKPLKRDLSVPLN